MTGETAAEVQQALVELNEELAHQEQQGDVAREFFQQHLSDQLVFHRANGNVVGKYGPEGFLEGLASSPFRSRLAERIEVNLLDGRALVTLTIVGTRKDDGSVHHYRNVRLFSRTGDRWIVDFWYNYELPASYIP